MVLLSASPPALYLRLHPLPSPIRNRLQDKRWRYPPPLKDRAAREDNKELLARLREDDRPEEDAKRKEDASFGSSTASTDRLAVARKLTVMAEINGGFLVDKRL